MIAATLSAQQANQQTLQPGHIGDATALVVAVLPKSTVEAAEKHEVGAFGVCWV
jgi:hypothetical protein